MKKAIMNSRFYIGISLLVQTFTLVLMFFAHLKKSKSLAATMLAFATVSGAIGAYLVASTSKDEEEKTEMLDALREDFFEISEDDITDEEDSIFITETDDEE